MKLYIACSDDGASHPTGWIKYTSVWISGHDSSVAATTEATVADCLTKCKFKNYHIFNILYVHLL